MTELYKEVRGIINFELDQTEEENVRKYCKNLRMISRILMPMIVIAGIFGIYCIYADIHWGFYAFVAFAFCSVIFKTAYQKKYINHLMQLVNNDCSVAKALTGYIVMLEYSRGVKNCDSMLQCIGSLLFYMGKFEECKAIAGLMDKYYDTNVVKAYRYSLLAMVALMEKDTDTINSCIEELETLVSQSIEQYVRDAHRLISRYPEILEAEETGDYAKVVEIAEANDDAKTFTPKKVASNYRLYKVAIAAGMEAEAAKHRAYVL